ncbi:acyltransferase [Gryllotalpicola koreensis]|uniref:Acyltransferase n=1 Tax=Gryllotalpicola koreensis TaxID=993086 RepID=A0ABP8A595_9MICO
MTTAIPTQDTTQDKGRETTRMPGPAAAPHPRPRLSSRARAGLDAARACSAVYVVLHHTSTALPMPPLLTHALSLGQEAVMVFFLLSGFVIFANEADRVRDLRSFYLRRLRRIYPLVLIAMGVSTIVWALGIIQSGPSWRSTLATLFSVDDLTSKPGVVSGAYLNNVPLWSLSYEVFFYAVFPLVMMLWRKRPNATRHFVGAMAVAAYLGFLWHPNHFLLVTAYFALWWAGAIAAKAHLEGGIRLRAVAVEAGWQAALTLTAAGGVLLAGFHGTSSYPFLMVRHFGVCLLLLVLLATPARTALGRLAAGWAPIWAWVASISYGLYLLHYPVLIQPAEDFGWRVWLPLLGVTVGCAWLVECRLMPLIPRPRAGRPLNVSAPA